MPDTPVITDIRVVSDWCAVKPPFKFGHSTELCDDGAGLRSYFFNVVCECECHDD